MSAPELDPGLRSLLTPGSWVESSAVAKPEITLPAGDVTQGVVRVGDTVRRPRRVESAAVGGARYRTALGSDL